MGEVGFSGFYSFSEEPENEIEEGEEGGIRRRGGKWIGGGDTGRRRLI